MSLKTFKYTIMIYNIDISDVILNFSKIKRDSLVLNELYENGEIDIVGAMYDAQSGVVSFL